MVSEEVGMPSLWFWRLVINYLQLPIYTAGQVEVKFYLWGAAIWLCMATPKAKHKAKHKENEIAHKVINILLLLFSVTIVLIHFQTLSTLQQKIKKSVINIMKLVL